MNIATYQTTPEKHGDGTFFFTDCGHNMYSTEMDDCFIGGLKINEQKHSFEH